MSDNVTIQPTTVEATPEAPEAIGTNWISMLPMVLILVVCYFFLIRPQEKRRRQHEEMVSKVKRGEEVITNAGLFGIVTKINDSDNSVMLEIAPKTEVKVLKSAIADIVSRRDKKAVTDAKK